MTMNEWSPERLLTRLKEGPLTEKELRQVIELVGKRTYNAEIKKTLHAEAVRYIAGAVSASQILAEIELTETEANARRKRMLGDAIAMIREADQQTGTSKTPLYVDADKHNERTHKNELNGLNTRLDAGQPQEEEAKVIPFYRNWSRMAVAATVIIGLSFGTVWYYRTQQQSDLVAQTHTFENRQFVRLPDGTTVLLNDSSKLSYHDSFGDSVREVTLTGEAFFDVKHDPSKPFRVRSANVTTTVLGTAFNVHAYPGEKDIVVTVARGKVEVSNAKKQSQVITPDQQLSVNRTTDAIAKTEIKAEVVTEWKNRYLILDSVTIREAAVIIGEHYNVKVTVADEVNDCKIQGTFVNNETLEEVMVVISQLIAGSYTEHNGVITLSGLGCR